MNQIANASSGMKELTVDEVAQVSGGTLVSDLFTGIGGTIDSVFNGTNGTLLQTGDIVEGSFKAARDVVDRVITILP